MFQAGLARFNSYLRSPHPIYHGFIDSMHRHTVTLCILKQLKNSHMMVYNFLFSISTLRSSQYYCDIDIFYLSNFMLVSYLPALLKLHNIGKVIAIRKSYDYDKIILNWIVCRLVNGANRIFCNTINPPTPRTAQRSRSYIYIYI